MFNAKLAGHHQIDNSQLRTLAPSVFADQAHAKVSDRYSFIPTATVVDGLSAEGWAPVWASEQRIRLSDRQGFQKHMIRFARVDDLNRTQQERPELVLVNSHDRSSAYQLHAGIFRFVCSNGTILADSVFAKISIMHVNFEPAKVIEASFGIVREMPRITCPPWHRMAVEGKFSRQPTFQGKIFSPLRKPRTPSAPRFSGGSPPQRLPVRGHRAAYIRAYVPSRATRGRAAQPDLLAVAVAIALDVAVAFGAGRGRDAGKSNDNAVEFSR